MIISQQVFQFQNGLIIRGAMTRGLLISHVSIPKWSDYKEQVETDYVTGTPVSIPKWSDYKVKNRFVASCNPVFQFQNGLIIS